MAIRRIQDIQPGMVLNLAVHDKSGRLLLREGVELTQKHMMVFMTWGITEVDADLPVTISSESPPPEAERIAHEKAPPEVQSLFNHVDLSHPLMQELFRYCCQNPPREVGHHDS